MGTVASGYLGVSLPVSAGETLDVEGYPRAPSSLDLEQVHVYVRHGERTPVKTRMADPPASIPEYWQLCSEARQFREAANVATRTTRGEPRTEGPWFGRRTETRDGGTVPNLCLLGELTDVGKESTHKFGVALRKLYIDQLVETLGFLPGTLQNEKQVYFRSTNVPRTITSLENVVNGLYPKANCAPDVIPPILVRNKMEENLGSNILSCPQLGLLELRFAEAAAIKWNPRLKTLDEKLLKYTKGKSIRIDGSPRASGILDTVRSAVAHGIKIPEEFRDPSVINLIESAVSEEWFAFKTEQGRRLGMGRLLADMSAKMQAKIEKGDKNPLKILVHSVHDCTLAALCNTLDVFDEKWPPFTSSVTFELFRKGQKGSSSQSVWSELWNAHPKEEHYLRMRYKNRNMILPICAKEGDHLPGSPEFCTLSAFQRRVRELTPTNWSAECAREFPSS